MKARPATFLVPPSKDSIVELVFWNFEHSRTLLQKLDLWMFTQMVLLFTNLPNFLLNRNGSLMPDRDLGWR